jgi:hypothetical protein
LQTKLLPSRRSLFDNSQTVELIECFRRIFDLFLRLATLRGFRIEYGDGPVTLIASRLFWKIEPEALVFSAVTHD